MDPTRLERLIKISPGVRELADEIQQLKEINEALAGENELLITAVQKESEFKNKLLKFFMDNGEGFGIVAS